MSHNIKLKIILHVIDFKICMSRARASPMHAKNDMNFNTNGVCKRRAVTIHQKASDRGGFNYLRSTSRTLTFCRQKALSLETSKFHFSALESPSTAVSYFLALILIVCDAALMNYKLRTNEANWVRL